MVEARLKMKNGAPAVYVNGEEFPFSQAITVRTHKNGKIIFDEEYFKGLHRAGIRLYYVTCDTDWCHAGNLENLREECGKLLSCVPNAYIMVRIGLHPPVSFVKDHPEECFTYNDGVADPVILANETFKEFYPHLYSEASDKWREEAGNALIDMCEKIEKEPFSDRIIGYFFAAGGTSEWYYLLNLEQGKRYGDFSEAFRRAFSAYLKEKYGTNEALRKAWHDDTADIDRPAIPSLEERFYAFDFDETYEREDEVVVDFLMSAASNGYNVGNFLNVDKCARAFDFYRAWHVATAKSQIYFGELIKKRYGGALLTGSFYGSYGCTNFYSGSTAGAVIEILDSGAIDFLAAPGVYVNRNPGGFTGQREMEDSFFLRGKTFVTEEDTRTHLEKSYFRSMFDYYDETDALNAIKRDFGRNLCGNLPYWWYDHEVGGGRYKNEKIYELFCRQGEIARLAAGKTDRSKVSEIAYLYDEKSIHLISDRTTKEIVEYFNNYEAARIGAPADKYFWNDISNPAMPDYKLYVFFNVFALSAKDREAIFAKLSKNHASAIFVYASGAIDFEEENRLSGENVSKLTGIRTRLVKEKHFTKYRVLRLPENDTFGALSDRRIYGVNNRPLNNNILTVIKQVTTFACPLFVAEDENATVLARFCENNLPAITMKDSGGFVSYFLAAKVLDADVLRAIAKKAGCHIYENGDDVLYVSRNFICLHASSDGEKTLKFREKCSPYELYEKKYYGAGVTEIRFNAKIGETYTFELRDK